MAAVSVRHMCTGSYAPLIALLTLGITNTHAATPVYILDTLYCEMACNITVYLPLPGYRLATQYTNIILFHIQDIV